MCSMQIANCIYIYIYIYLYCAQRDDRLRFDNGVIVVSRLVPNDMEGTGDG